MGVSRALQEGRHALATGGATAPRQGFPSSCPQCSHTQTDPQSGPRPGANIPPHPLVPSALALKADQQTARSSRAAPQDAGRRQRPWQRLESCRTHACHGLAHRGAARSGPDRRHQRSESRSAAHRHPQMLIPRSSGGEICHDVRCADADSAYGNPDRGALNRRGHDLHPLGQFGGERAPGRRGEQHRRHRHVATDVVEQRHATLSLDRVGGNRHPAHDELTPDKRRRDRMRADKRRSRLADHRGGSAES